MKNLRYALIFIFPLLGIKCEKESENCHFKIEFKNNSIDTLIYALKFTDSKNKCFLEQRNILYKNDTFSIDNRYCWENRLSNGKTFDFYIIDPKLFNESVKFYNCDSIPIKNKILKEYKLSLIDLQRVDFKISYP